MALFDYRKDMVWQAAVALAPQLVRLAEELPAAEELGLSWQLRQLLAELPAAVALDRATGSQTRLSVGLRLSAVLDVLEHVYPALDVAAAHTMVDQVVEQLMSAPIPALPATKVLEPVTAEPAAIEGEQPASSVAEPSPAQEVTTVHVQPDSGQ